MIEINLLPGAPKRKKRATAGFSFKLPEKFPAVDRILLFIVAAWILGPALGGWMYLGVRGEKAELDEKVELAVQDSMRFARLIATQTSIMARQDTIAQKVAIIQEIDAGRYIWAHVLDEVSRALPPYTWLEGLEQENGGPAPTFLINGKAGTLPAVTTFMRELEASPFIRNVDLLASERAMVDNDPNKVVHNFTLRGAFEPPTPDAIVTVPLFTGAADTVALGMGGGGDGAGSS